MFTGLVEALGVLRRRAGSPVARVEITCAFSDLSLGESINVNGVCLTVDKILGGGFEADLSSETRERSTLDTIPIGAKLHLERATPAGGRLGGHVVLGHVDGIGAVVSREASGEAVKLGVRLPAELARFIASKGSIAFDGVSLTVNGAGKPDGAGVELDVMLVPHTLGRTTLGELKIGSRLNVEIDVLARYVARQLELGRSSDGGREQQDDHADERILDKLRAGGFL